MGKSTKSKYPMYPHHEEKIRWDDYGEIIRPEEWIDPNAAAALASENNEEPAIMDDQADMAEVPTKCVKQPLTLNIRAQIKFIDFEGRSDGESVMKLIRQVKPRRVIIVRGSLQGCEAMEKVSNRCDQ